MPSKAPPTHSYATIRVLTRTCKVLDPTVPPVPRAFHVCLLCFLLRPINSPSKAINTPPPLPRRVSFAPANAQWKLNHRRQALYLPVIFAMESCCARAFIYIFSSLLALIVVVCLVFGCIPFFCRVQALLLLLLFIHRPRPFPPYSPRPAPPCTHTCACLCACVYGGPGGPNACPLSACGPAFPPPGGHRPCVRDSPDCRRCRCRTTTGYCC